jgi:hydroxymethylpyrimidine/phosphomethylpyrimidine kinase
VLEDSTTTAVRIKKVHAKTSALHRPCVLTVAGSDSGGGAGIQADLKTFSAIGVHGASAITCVTAQNPREVREVQAIPVSSVKAQIRCVVEAFAPQVVKMGMLYSREIIDGVSLALDRDLVLIVDPVMISTSGAMLLQPSAIAALETLLRRAYLMTPNLPEAEHLLQRTLSEPEDLRAAARDLHEAYGCAALVKGGHLPNLKVAVDVLFDGENEWLLEAPYVRGISTHGTGCTYSAAIAAYCALGDPLPRAVARAKEFISNAVALSTKTSGHDVLNFSWKTR